MKIFTNVTIEDNMYYLVDRNNFVNAKHENKEALKNIAKQFDDETRKLITKYGSKRELEDFEKEIKQHSWVILKGSILKKFEITENI